MSIASKKKMVIQTTLGMIIITRKDHTPEVDQGQEVNPERILVEAAVGATVAAPVDEEEHLHTRNTRKREKEIKTITGTVAAILNRNTTLLAVKGIVVLLPHVLDRDP